MLKTMSSVLLALSLVQSPLAFAAPGGRDDRGGRDERGGNDRGGNQDRGNNNGGGVRPGPSNPGPSNPGRGEDRGNNNGGGIRPGNPPSRGDDRGRDDRDRGRDDRGRDNWGRDGRDDRGGIRPGPSHPGPNPRNPYPTPPPRDPYPSPRPPSSGYYGEASVQFYGVTRRVGGEWLRVAFNRSSTVNYIQMTVYGASAQVHEAYAITASGYRTPLYNLRSGYMYSGSTVTQAMNSYDRIVAIDIRTESMGGYADVSVRVVSDEGTPYISPVRY